MLRMQTYLPFTNAANLNWILARTATLGFGSTKVQMVAVFLYIAARCKTDSGCGTLVSYHTVEDLERRRMKTITSARRLNPVPWRLSHQRNTGKLLTRTALPRPLRSVGSLSVCLFEIIACRLICLCCVICCFLLQIQVFYSDDEDDDMYHDGSS